VSSGRYNPAIILAGKTGTVTAMTEDGSEREAKIYREMLDSFDEELEMELDDERLAYILDGLTVSGPATPR
jgi:hypothetical protein